MEKTINWFEIPANNLTRAKQFYGSVFNVQFQDVMLPNGLNMVLFPSGNKTIGGALCEHPDFYKPGH